MKKVLSLLCVGALLIGGLGGCSKTNSIDKSSNNIETSKSQILESSKKGLENQTSESEFGEKEIKEFLFEADTMRIETKFELTNKIIGIIVSNNFPVVKLNGGSSYEKDFEYFKKYYASDELIQRKLSTEGYYYVNGIIGKDLYTQNTELMRVSKDSRIKILEDEENRKVVNIEVFNLNWIDNDGSVFEAYYETLPQDSEAWRRYEICKNENRNWLITDEEPLNKKIDIAQRIYPQISKIEASSSLKGYPAELIFDNNIETAWVEGVDGDGIGESVKLTFKKEIKVSHLQLLNGYHKTSELLEKNNSIKKAKIEFSNGQSKVVILDTWTDSPVISFGESIKTKYIKLSILNVNKGTKYSDTCVSEILFFNKK